MIEREDILSLAFLKKSAFTGSYEGMRYRLSQEQEKEEEKTCLGAVIWEAPYSFEHTEEEKKEKKWFPFSEEGVCQAIAWMNERWKAQEQRWKQAKQNW